MTAAGRPIGAVLGVPGTSCKLLFIVLAACLSWSFPGCKPAQQPAGPAETIRIGAFNGELAALVWVAETEGLFAKHGLDAQVTGFASGLAATEALLAGTEDVATASESVFVNKSLSREGRGKLGIVGEIARSESIEIVVRLDRGLSGPADLKGKKIALTGQTPSAYFLDRYLVYHRLDPRSVTIVDLPPLKVVEAIAQGSVDAAMTWEPYIWNIKQALTGKARSWPAQSDQQFHFLLISAADFAEKRPEATKKMFRALSEAESLIRTDPARARQALARRLALDEGYLAAVWPKHTIGLSLDQTLLPAMEDQARWAIVRGPAPASRTPNFLKSIFSEPLASVRPDAVTLYR